MGYTNANEILDKLKKYKRFCHFTKDEFKQNISKFIDNLNTDNVARIDEIVNIIYGTDLCLGTVEINSRLSNAINKFGKSGTTLKKEYWLFRGWDLDITEQKISQIQKTFSPRCKEYYINRGYDEISADKMVSSRQSRYSNMGKHSKMFWIDRGFSEADAIKIAYEYSQTCSIWNKRFWINRGYSEEHANEMVLRYNPSSPKFFKYENDYRKYKIKLDRWSKIAKDRWRTPQYRDKMIARIKDGSIKVTSKAETQVFAELMTWYNEIKHEPYIVIIPDDFENSLNVSFFVVDGYYKDRDGIILIEYDSTLYHSDELDLLRDSNILSIDVNVLGIIRIHQSFTKNLSFKKEQFDNAIQTIKNSKENRIILS